MKDIIKTNIDKPNKDVLKEMSLLKEEFEKTKALVVNLTYHLDNVESAYNKLNKEMKNRYGK